MEINRENLNRLLSLNDRQLKMMITRIAAQSGIDPAQFNINTESVQSIRQALGSATDEDLRRIAEQYERNSHGKR